VIQGIKAPESGSISESAKATKYGDTPESAKVAEYGDTSESAKATKHGDTSESAKATEHGDTSGSAKATKYGDTSATYWKLYKSEAEMNDKDLVKSLKDNTESMVILVRGDAHLICRSLLWSLTIILQNAVFSSIVASFIIEIYKTLLPGNSQQPAGITPSSAVRINIVLFLSLFLSIMSAVSSALIQKWCNEYTNFAYPRAAPHDTGRVRTYLFQGLAEFQMRRFMYGTHALLHISVFLFFWAISDFFYTVDHILGLVARYTLVAASILYALLSISPLIFSNSPYNTPITPLLRAGFIILLIIVRSPLWCLLRDHSLTGLAYYKGIHFDRAHLYLMEAGKRAGKLERYAMEWLFTEDDFSDENMDKFLKGLPGYISSSQTIPDRLDHYLTAEHILSRIKEHFISCATSVELSDEARIARVSSSAEALLCISQYSRKCKEKSSVAGELETELESQQKYNQELMDYCQMLCGRNDPTIVLRTSCIRALALQNFLSQLAAQNSKTTDNSSFPISLIPMYKFFFPNDNTDIIRQLETGQKPKRDEIKKIWDSLLHDGPLANLTMLAQAVRDKEHAPPPILSFCWKALDILLPQLGTIHYDEPTPAQTEFDGLHKGTRKYVHEERGFRVRPLADVLDTVARGQRLLMLFSGHPKYHSRADVVFGKEYLRNGDLLEAFGHCLPDFISENTPEACRKFMERVVDEDGLWTSLQVNLWDAQRSDSPIPDKLRVFEDCCAVINLALSVLEDSQEVDWRAPEFGSLAQHWESFITHCFQGSFMGKATSFRVGIIKARFCKALLAQFSNDKAKEGTVSFRSQWDVASLARVIVTLGMRDKDDPEFWDSYVNGGHIGTEFTTKAHEMVDLTARDGPLLIFCLLGRLAVAAVPLDQSGVELKDVRELLELQKKVINKRLSLDRPSDTVWGEVDQLRKQVNDLCGNNTDEDRNILQDQLQMINGVRDLRFSGAEGSGQGEPANAEEQDPKTSVSVNPTSSSGESRAFSNRFSIASESTAVTGRPFNVTPTSEGEDGSGRTYCLIIPRASIDLRPERSADKVSDGEMKTDVRSDSPQGYEPGTYSLPSPHPAVQGIRGVEVMNQSTDTSSSVYPPFMEDARPRPSTRRTDSGFRASRPSHVTRASTSALSTSRRDAHTILQNPAISVPSYGPFDEGQSGAAPTFEEG
jgi:hypothetical protein